MKAASSETSDVGSVHRVVALTEDRRCAGDKGFSYAPAAGDAGCIVSVSSSSWSGVRSMSRGA